MKKKTTKMYQFNGVRTCTEFLTVELECESLEEAQSIIDSGDFEDKLVSSSISKNTDWNMLVLRITYQWMTRDFFLIQKR